MIQYSNTSINIPNQCNNDKGNENYKLTNENFKKDTFMQYNCESCSKREEQYCNEHGITSKRLEVLELDMKELKELSMENTLTIQKISSRINILILIWGMTLSVVSIGAGYTFTGLNSFKDKYNNDMYRAREYSDMIKKDCLITIDKNVIEHTKEFDNDISRLEHNISELNKEITALHDLK